MIRMHLTPFQLFFLTFLYVFSGLTLSGADSLWALLVPLAAAMLWTLIGACGAVRYREDLTSFLSAYMSRRETALPLAFFLSVSAAQAVFQFYDMASALGSFADFLPFSTVLLVILGVTLAVCRLGVTVLGRLSETSLFLLIPLILLHLFGSYMPMDASGFKADWHLLFSVLPAPFFFLLSLSSAAGDRQATDSFRASANAPRSRVRLLCGVMIGGAVLAVLLRALVLIKPMGEDELLLRFLEYTAHTVKLCLLVCLCAYGTAGYRRKMHVLAVMLMALAASFTAAVIAGAVFSPLYLVIVLVCTSSAAALMLGLFSAARGIGGS